jgi:Protein of unknown function (DUF3455)
MCQPDLRSVAVRTWSGGVPLACRVTRCVRRSSVLIGMVAALANLAVTIGARAEETLPPAIVAPGLKTVLAVHAVGAQIYECKADSAGKPGWQFREPIATLILDGKTVGRHFAGPSWELPDGSQVTGKVIGRADGATPDDIPWLKLEASAARGQFAKVAIIQRIHTKGGALSGACDQIGALIAMPYASDYVFLGEGG